MLNRLRHCERTNFKSEALQRLPIQGKWIAATLALLAMTVFLFIAPVSVHAQDAKQDLSDVLAETVLPDGAVRYAPPLCDFEMIFPSEPYVARRCPSNENGEQTECYPLTGYTMVYDVTTTVDITVTCVPSTPEDYSKYTAPIINTALQGMLRREAIDNPEVNTREKEGYRIGSLLGTTKRGRQSAIYNAQLWVGQNSIMTLEARLVGPTHPKADVVFGDVLSSVKLKD